MAVASSRPTRRTAAVLLAVLSALALSACVDAGTAPSLPTDGPTSQPTPTATAAPTTTPTPGAEPLGISCADLVDPDAIYDFDPNYQLLGSWNPPAGSAAAEALAAGGVACRWVRESGEGTLDISVARLDETELTDKKNAAFAESQMVPTYGDEGYFEVEGGLGTAIVFPGDFWLVVSAEALAEPGEPTGIVASVTTALSAL